MKGVVNTLEALIGVMIILGVMFFLFASGMQNTPTTGMHDVAYDCLVYAKDYSDMDVKLRECIPSSYDFQVKTCNSADCSITLPDETVYSVEYIDSGSKLIKMWVY